jgi:hypothetical protein
MFCEWKTPIDAGDFIVIVLDRCMIEDKDVEMQAVYASKTGKKVFAVIEKGGQPAAYMHDLKGFMWEPFDPDSAMSFKKAVAKLISRHKEAMEFEAGPKFICYLTPAVAPLVFRQISPRGRNKQEGAASSTGAG